MIDPGWLRSWIQPQHLEESTLLVYRQTLESHPARLVVLRSFLHNQVADNLTRFLRSEAEFQPVYGLYSNHNYVPEADWLRAEESDRFFRYGVMSGVRPEFQLSSNLITYLQFRTAFRDKRFKAFFEQLSGFSIGSLTFKVHSMKTGDFLHSHTDDVDDRRLAFALYLSSHWHPSFGGALHMVGNREKLAAVEAEYNSIAIFDVTAKTKHFIGPIEPAAGEMTRLSITGWLRDPTD